MTSNLLTRRDFSVRFAFLVTALGVAQNAFGTGDAEAKHADLSETISHAGDAIHQEVTFKANPKRVYEALLDTKQFDTIARFSPEGRMGGLPTKISREEGGGFTLFGGHILGRHIELVPNERIVQAWRVVLWDPGVYSIARFELKEQDAGTRVVFDHTGFPQGQAQHLADGWKAHYWDGLEKFLAQADGSGSPR